MRRPGSRKTYEIFADVSGRSDWIAGPGVGGKHKRPSPFSIRLTEDERAQLLEQANGTPLGTYIKSRLFSGGSYRTRSRQVDKEALGKVLSALGQSRIPQNLNQIAKAANIGTMPVTPDVLAELHQTCGELKALRQGIVAALGLRSS